MDSPTHDESSGKQRRLLNIFDDTVAAVQRNGGENANNR